MLLLLLILLLLLLILLLLLLLILLLLLLLLLILLLLCEGTLLLMVGEVGWSQAVGGTALVGALVPVKVLAQIWGAFV